MKRPNATKKWYLNSEWFFNRWRNIDWKPQLIYHKRFPICYTIVQVSLVRLNLSKFGIQRIIIARYIIAQCKYPPFSYITQNRRCLCISSKKDTSHTYIYFFSNLFQYINLDLFPIFNAFKPWVLLARHEMKNQWIWLSLSTHNSWFLNIEKVYF